MSSQVDERVVEMRFDNSHFENNVKTSMSTLDKLKEKLNFSGASKGLENINSSVKKVDMNSLGSAVETVQAKFSALGVIGVTALANITNSAVNAGKRIISALTIDPVKTGFQEYTTQLTATQSILANVGSKGKTINDVNAALDELNKYADQTIYNFTEMTRNIGYFTTAGVDLDQSVTAIKGFSNAAAIAGADATKTAGAMYQLSQAMSSGKMLLMDWRSLEQAGIAGEKFRDAIIETARVHGINIDAMIKEEGSFRDTLQKGWLTNDIMTESLEKFTMTTEGLTEAEIEANREKLRSIGYTEEQIDGIFELGKVATESATKVKDIGQMWDVLKEAAQSGWSQTWRLIFGDVEQAKALFTPLTNFFTNIIDKMSNARNTLLEGALGKSFKSLLDPIKGIMGPIEGTADAVKTVTDAVKDYGKVVDEILNGSFGNGQSRWDKLTEAGYDWAHAQNLVNEKLGDSTRHATEYSEAQDKLAESQDKVTTSDSERIAQLASMSDAQLRNLGYTEEQIASFNELRSTADKLGIPLKDFIENIDEINGRWLIIDSFKNIGQGIVKAITAIKDAWTNIFPPTTVDQLFNIIAAFHKLSTSFVMSDETADKLRRTFEGLFAALDLIRSVVGGALGIGFKVLKEVLSALDVDILDVTASIGDAIVKFRDWVKEHDVLSKAIQTIVPFIKDAVTAFLQWAKTNETIQNGISKLASMFDAATSGIRKWIDGIKEAENIPEYIISGLVNGLKAGISKIINAAIELGKSIIEAVKGVLGIHSPSTVFIEIGKNIIDGLVNGLKSGLSSLWGFLSGIGKNIAEVIGKIDFGKIFAIAFSASVIIALKKLADIIKMFEAPFEGLGEMMEGIGSFFKDVGKGLKANLKASALEKKSKALRNLAISVGIFAASLYVLSQLDESKLDNGIKAIWNIVGALSALSIAAGIASKLGGNFDGLSKMTWSLVGISASLFILAMAIDKLKFLNSENITPIMTALVTMIGGLSLLMAVLGKIPNAGKVGGTILAISVAMLLMVKVVKAISGLDPGEIQKGIKGIGLFGTFIILFMATTRLASKGTKGLGGTLLAITASILLMVGIVKVISGLKPGEIAKGIICITLFEGLIIGLIAATRLASGNMKGLGATILGISTAILLMATTTKMLAGMKQEDIAKGLKCIVLFEAIIVALIAATNLAGNAKGLATSILAMSVSIGILAAIAVVLSLIDIGALAKGIVAVGLLGSIMALMIHATKDAQNCKGNIYAMTIAIAVMAGAVAALSMIDFSKLAGATICLSALMAVFALMAKMAGQATASIGVLVVMTIAVGLLAGIIYLLAGLPVESVIASAASLSVFLLSVTASLVILTGVGSIAGAALAGVVSLLAMAVPLVAFVGILALMSNVENAITNATVLAAFATVMTGLLAVLSIIGAVAISALAGVVSLLAMAVPLVAFVGILALMQNIQNAEANANILISLMTAMTTLLVAVSILGPLALIGSAALTGMVGFMVAITGVVAAIGAINEMFPQLETFVNSGISLLIQLANGLGEVIGSFVGGFLEGATSSLPEVASNLSNFMTQLTPFIEGAKSIDESAISGVETLAKTILLLTGAGILESITSWLTGGSSLSDFGAQLTPFGESIKSFSDAVSGIDVESVTAAADAGKLLAEMASTLPNSGGVAGFFAGENDIGDFAEQLGSFGEAIADFSSSVDGNVNLEAITNAVEAGKKIIEIASEIPNSGGVAGFFAGENDMGDFGEQLSGFGEAIADFSSSVDGNISIDAISNAVEAGKKIIEMASEIPNSGGVAGFFAGENDMGDFGDQLNDFGNAIANFSSTVDGNVSAEAISNVVDACKSISEISIDANISGLTTQLNDLGKGLKDFLNSIKNVDTSGLNSFSQGLKNVANSGINELVQSFNNAKSKITSSINGMMTSALNALKSKQNVFKNAGSTISNNVANGIKSKSSSIKNALTSCLNSAISYIKSFYSQFSSAGGYLVQGFAAGIKSNTYKAEAQAKAMAKAAYEAARKELDINSPSKKFMEVGGSVVEGFDKGIIKNMNTVKKSAITIGSTALNTLRDVLDCHSPAKETEKIGKNTGDGFANGVEKSKEHIIASNKNVGKSSTQALNKAAKAELKYSEELGRYFCQNVAAGIESDMTAEEKAKKKAENIANAFKTELDKYDLDADTIDKEFELWKFNGGKNASELATNTKNIEVLTSKFKVLNNKTKIAYDEWQDTIENLGESSEEAQTALNKYLDSLIEVGKISEEIETLEETVSDFLFNSKFDEKEKLYKKRKSDREVTNKLWEATFGDNATDWNRYLYYKNQIGEDVTDSYQQYLNALERYNELVKKEGRESEKAKEAWDVVRDTRVALAEDQKKYSDNEKEYREKEKERLEEEKEALKESYELASENADLKYQIWEKTLGRNATDEEKNIRKLIFLGDQLKSQAELVKLAEQEWTNASGDEKRSKEKEYLQAQLELANLQSKVLDIQEENIKRQEKALERQRNSRSEYEDYLKKYEQFYLSHGMTKEELENDARLVSGYDPTNAVNTMISKTSNALNNLKSNTQYDSLLSSFGEMGSSYASAVSNGIQNGTTTVVNTTSSMVEACIKQVDSEKESWTKAGSKLVDKFIEGLKSKTQDAVNAATELASKTLMAIKSICDSDMDYSPTIKPVLDMSDVNSKFGNMNSILSGNRSFSIASSIASGSVNNKYSGAGSNQTSVPVYTFTQNNYSPKALSSIEIYRQTNNIISKIGKKATT